uniref:Uncharacterized protein n=1 Tax=Arundo donax TaxID=35708 RepID=A0A0A9FMZ2_ARUDO
MHSCCCRPKGGPKEGC